jgi:hypothetical protein
MIGVAPWRMLFSIVQVRPSRISTPSVALTIVQFVIDPWHPVIAGTGHALLHR